MDGGEEEDITSLVLRDDTDDAEDTSDQRTCQVKRSVFTVLHIISVYDIQSFNIFKTVSLYAHYDLGINI